jgi:hypothetical protein
MDGYEITKVCRNKYCALVGMEVKVPTGTADCVSCGDPLDLTDLAKLMDAFDTGGFLNDVVQQMRNKGRGN